MDILDFDAKVRNETGMPSKLSNASTTQLINATLETMEEDMEILNSPYPSRFKRFNNIKLTNLLSRPLNSSHKE